MGEVYKLKLYRLYIVNKVIGIVDLIDYFFYIILFLLVNVCFIFVILFDICED